jgi:hypothetical protein
MSCCIAIVVVVPVAVGDIVGEAVSGAMADVAWDIPCIVTAQPRD